MKDLETVNLLDAKLGHKKSVADLKRDKLFEEFTKIKKEL